MLAERLRREDERAKVKSVIEEVCKVKIDLEEFYLRDAIIDRMMDSSENEKTQLWNLETLKRLRAEIQETYASDRAIPSGLKSIAITGTLQKMFKMIGLCLHYDEPVLLVGGTGCGKTTLSSCGAGARQRLVILNCKEGGIRLTVVTRTPRRATSSEDSVRRALTKPTPRSSNKFSCVCSRRWRTAVPFRTCSLRSCVPRWRLSATGCYRSRPLH